MSDNVWRSDAVIASLVFGVSLVLYSSLATGIVFTHHTIPNAFVFPYPSFRTTLEGRWLADIVVHVFGSGSQAFQAVLGFAIQAINGLLFAELLGLRSGLQRCLVALLVALNPTFLDYYIFTTDNVAQTLGETFILFGVLMLDRERNATVAVITSAVLFMLALAIYPPKIAIIAVILICWLVYRLIARTDPFFLTRRMVPAALAAIGGVLLYWVSTKLTITAPPGLRNQLNSPAEMLAAVWAAYPTVLDRSVQQIINLPILASFAAASLIAAGLGVVIHAASKRGLAVVAAALALLALLPIAIRLTFILNREAWPDVGRLATGYAFAFAFLAAMVLKAQSRAGPLLVAGALYGFVFIGAQENSYLQMKTLFEVSLINRIVDRVEGVLPDDKSRSLVVVGALPTSQLNAILSYPERPFRPQSWHPSFILYRQPDVANFFMGRSVLAYPTKAEVDAVLADIPSRPLWPAPGSVYLLGDVVAVKLQEPGPGIHVTTAR